MVTFIIYYSDLNSFILCSPWYMEGVQLQLEWPWCPCFYLMDELVMSCKLNYKLLCSLSLLLALSPPLPLSFTCHTALSQLWITNRKNNNQNTNSMCNAKINCLARSVACKTLVCLTIWALIFFHRQQPGVQPQTPPSHQRGGRNGGGNSSRNAGSSSKGRHNNDSGQGRRYRPY